MRRLSLFAAALMAIACHRSPPVPVGQQLWRLDGTWTRPPSRSDIRLAPATILAFRPDHEYVEVHCWVIEQPDTTVYVFSGGPRIAAVGRWTQEGPEIKVERMNIARTTPLKGAKEPLCDQRQLRFRISGNSVTGNAGGTAEGMYSPVTRLVSPDFESYVNDARRSAVTCAPPKS